MFFNVVSARPAVRSGRGLRAPGGVEPAGQLLAGWGSSDKPAVREGRVRRPRFDPAQSLAVRPRRHWLDG